MCSKMKDPVRKALTRKISFQTGTFEVQPTRLAVWAVYFSVAMTLMLTCLEIAYMFVFHEWNAEIFTVISGLIGNVTGIFLSHR